LAAILGMAAAGGLLTPLQAFFCVLAAAACCAVSVWMYQAAVASYREQEARQET
jgi:hypothetical protein